MLAAWDKNNRMSFEAEFPNDASLDEVKERTRVKPQDDHFPLCLVWCPLPLFSWFFPVIGHLGITTSDGTIHDFQGSCSVHTDPHLTIFGPVTKYLRADILQTDTGSIAAWDDAVEHATQVYSALPVC